MNVYTCLLVKSLRPFFFLRRRGSALREEEVKGGGGYRGGRHAGRPECGKEHVFPVFALSECCLEFCLLICSRDHARWAPLSSRHSRINVIFQKQSRRVFAAGRGCGVTRRVLCLVPRAFAVTGVPGLEGLAGPGRNLGPGFLCI